MFEDTKLKRYEPVTGSVERYGAADLGPFDAVEVREAPAPLAIWRILQKRRATILTIFSVLFVAVLVATLLQTPGYRARALLEFQKENTTIPSLQELFELEGASNAYLETQFKILQSETLAERVIDDLQLGGREEFNPSSWEEFAEDRQSELPAESASLFERDPEVFEQVLKEFQGRLRIEPVKNSRIVGVSFESEDPRLAAQAVNSLTSSYVEGNLEANQKATEWLAIQLEEMKASLENSESELQSYARANRLLFLETGGGNPENIANNRLRQLQEELTRAQAVRFEKEALYKLVEANDFSSLPGDLENKVLQDLTIRLADLKREQAQLAATFSSEYPQVKEIQNQIQELEASLATERGRTANRITNEYLAAVRQENLLRQAFAGQQAQANRIAERTVQYKILKREVDTNKQLYEDLHQRLRQAGVSAGLKASNIRIVDAARPPVKPARPNLPLNLGLAVICGLGLGVAAAFLQEHLDSSLKSPADVERWLHIPALGLIPAAESFSPHDRGIHDLHDLAQRIKLLSQRARSLTNPARLLGTSGDGANGDVPPHWYRIDEKGHQHAILSEAFRSLRTSVLLSDTDSRHKSLLVTSSESGEGKTTVTANLGIALAQLGRKVLVVDADTRCPSIHKAFNLDNNGGLSDFLAGHKNWQELVQPTSIQALEVLPGGKIPPNPVELLSSTYMQLLVKQASRRYDFVMVDSPPLLDMADSRILAALVDGVILVVRGGVTPRELVRRAGVEMREAGSKVIGIVLNQLDPLASDYSYFRYYRGRYYGCRYYGDKGSKRQSPPVEASGESDTGGESDGVEIDGGAPGPDSHEQTVS